MWTLGIAHWLPQQEGLSLVTAQPDWIQRTSMPAEKEKKRKGNME